MILVVALVAQLVAARGNPLCFDDIFTYELCCESDDGDACWAGDLTFETCCTTPSIEWESVSSSDVDFWRTLPCEFVWSNVKWEGQQFFLRLGGIPCPERVRYGFSSRFADAEVCAQAGGRVVLVHLFSKFGM